MILQYFKKRYLKTPWGLSASCCIVCSSCQGRAGWYMHIVLQLGSAAVYTAMNCLTQGHATSADSHFCLQNCYNAVLIHMIGL